MPGEIIQQSFAARLDCRYLLRVPAEVDSGAVLVLALHGFGSNPEAMLRLTGRMFEPGVVMASLEGPNQFLLSSGGQVGHGWITSHHPAESIRLHRDMVSHVLQEVGGRWGIPAERSILVGFSQAVSLNYRFAATCPEAVGGVIGICGGLPGDWESGVYQPVKAAILHIARREDEFYPPAVTEQYGGRLRLRASDVEFHLIDGGHRMPSGAGAMVGAWLGRILNAPR